MSHTWKFSYLVTGPRGESANVAITLVAPSAKDAIDMFMVDHPREPQKGSNHYVLQAIEWQRPECAPVPAFEGTGYRVRHDEETLDQYCCTENCDKPADFECRGARTGNWWPFCKDHICSRSGNSQWTHIRPVTKRAQALIDLNDLDTEARHGR